MNEASKIMWTFLCVSVMVYGIITNSMPRVIAGLGFVWLVALSETEK